MVGTKRINMANQTTETKEALSYDGFRTMAAWFTDKIKAAITGPAQEQLNTVIAYLRTAPQDIFLTQAEYNALPDTEEEMQPGDLYYKKDPTKAFNIEEEQEEGSGSGEGGAA